MTRPKSILKPGSSKPGSVMPPPANKPSGSRPKGKGLIRTRSKGKTPPPVRFQVKRVGMASNSRRSLASADQMGLLARVNGMLYKAADETPKAERSSKLKVAIRLRPANTRELAAGKREVVQVVGPNMVVFDPPEDASEFFYQNKKHKDVLATKYKNLNFAFDHVYDKGVQNADIFDELLIPVVDGLMEGYNCSVFAYGATGSGKTYTMLGGPGKDNPGLTVMTLVEIFRRLTENEENVDFDIATSYLEVYNELVRDLFSFTGEPLAVRETGSDTCISGLTFEKPKTVDEVLRLLQLGNSRRSQHPTDHNSESSRSHAIFQVLIKMREKTGEINPKPKTAKLVMVDLAGSEKGTATGFVGDRFREGANINKSLLALSNCISALASGRQFGSFRDSKLTRILKDSIGGNCKTVMIANVSPAHSMYEDTLNTLRYADKAKRICCRVKKNVMSVQSCLTQYTRAMEDASSRIINLEAEVQAKDKRIEELENMLRAKTLTEDVEISNREKELNQKIATLEAKLSQFSASNPLRVGDDSDAPGAQKLDKGNETLTVNEGVTTVRAVLPDNMPMVKQYYSKFKPQILKMLSHNHVANEMTHKINLKIHRANQLAALHRINANEKFRQGTDRHLANVEEAKHESIKLGKIAQQEFNELQSHWNCNFVDTLFHRETEDNYVAITAKEFDQIEKTKHLYAGSLKEIDHLSDLLAYTNLEYMKVERLLQKTMVIYYAAWTLLRDYHPPNDQAKEFHDNVINEYCGINTVRFIDQQPNDSPDRQPANARADNGRGGRKRNSRAFRLQSQERMETSSMETPSESGGDLLQELWEAYKTASKDMATSNNNYMQRPTIPHEVSFDCLRKLGMQDDQVSPSTGGSQSQEGDSDNDIEIVQEVEVRNNNQILQRELVKTALIVNSETPQPEPNSHTMLPASQSQQSPAGLVPTRPSAPITPTQSCTVPFNTYVSPLQPYPVSDSSPNLQGARHFITPHTLTEIKKGWDACVQATHMSLQRLQPKVGMTNNRSQVSQKPREPNTRTDCPRKSSTKTKKALAGRALVHMHMGTVHARPPSKACVVECIDITDDTDLMNNKECVENLDDAGLSIGNKDSGAANQGTKAVEDEATSEQSTRSSQSNELEEATGDGAIEESSNQNSIQQSGPPDVEVSTLNRTYVYGSLDATFSIENNDPLASTPATRPIKSNTNRRPSADDRAESSASGVKPTIDSLQEPGSRNPPNFNKEGSGPSSNSAPAVRSSSCLGVRREARPTPLQSIVGQESGKRRGKKRSTPYDRKPSV